MNATLVKTDKNGTEYYADYTCPKCGGNRYLDCYAHVEGGVCFKCGGSGVLEKPITYKVYKPEYAKKLADRRFEKACKKAPEVNRNFFKSFGLNENGDSWIVLGDTYSIKEELKAAGARFSPEIGWHFDHDDNGYDCFKLTIDEIAEKDIVGVWQLLPVYEIEGIIKDHKAKLAPKSTSEYIGTVGDKIQLKVKYLTQFIYHTNYSYYGETHFIYKFSDENGNTLIWDTSSCQELKEGDSYTIKGTIKDHSEYKGDKQTVLNRCRIA